MKLVGAALPSRIAALLKLVASRLAWQTRLTMDIEIEEVSTTSAAPIALSSGSSSSIQDAARHAARDAIAELQRLSVWHCSSCNRRDNSAWRPCEGCGRRQPATALAPSLQTAEVALRKPPCLAAVAQAEPQQVAYGLGAMAGCAAGLADATASEPVPVPPALGGADTSVLLNTGAKTTQVRYADTFAANEHLRKRRRDDGLPEEVEGKVSCRLVSEPPVREPLPRDSLMPPPPRPPPKRPEWRRGDWWCDNERCRAHVFADKLACFRCGRPRRGYEAEAQRSREYEAWQQRHASPARSASQPSERSSKATSQYTLGHTGHSRQRCVERDIVLRQLQRCLKHGRARRTGRDAWSIEYEGVSLITDDQRKIAITAFWTGRGLAPAWMASLPREPGNTQLMMDLDEDSGDGGGGGRGAGAPPASPSASRDSRAGDGWSDSGSIGGFSRAGSISRAGAEPMAEVARSLWWRGDEGAAAAAEAGGAAETARVGGNGSAAGPLCFAAGLSGAIFLTNTPNERECLDRGLFGLPRGQERLLRQIDGARGTTLLFLFNFQTRNLLGTFVASGPAGFPLQADAWAHGGVATPFPSQLPVAWHGRRLPRLHERAFAHVVRYLGGNCDRRQFELALSEGQVKDLVRLLHGEATEAPLPPPPRRAPAEPSLPAVLEEDGGGGDDDEGGAAPHAEAAAGSAVGGAVQDYARAVQVQLAERGGAPAGAVEWRCAAPGCGATNWAWRRCSKCDAEMPEAAVRATMQAARKVLDAPHGQHEAEEASAFRRGTMDGYALARAGVLTRHPGAFELCAPAVLPALPPPSVRTAALLHFNIHR